MECLPSIKTLEFFHGTSGSNLDHIFKKGKIAPRRGTGNWYKKFQVKSLREMVYLTNSELGADFHAARCAVMHRSECAILKVAVKEPNLYPDENYFANNFLIYSPEMETCQKKVLANRRLWRKSLAARELVSHRGPISTGQILEIKRYPLRESPECRFS